MTLATDTFASLRAAVWDHRPVSSASSQALLTLSHLNTSQHR